MIGALRRLAHPLAAAEAEAVADILAASFDTPEQAWDASALSTLVRDGAVTLAAPDAVAVFRVVLDEAELLSVAVRPVARGRGLGTALLAAAEQAAREAGAARMFLEVAIGNAAARALYARAGYREDGRRRGYYRRAGGGREDALVLSRDLDLPPCTGVPPACRMPRA